MKKYKLASHQSMTYLPVSKWWMKLIRWTAQCQSKTIFLQIANKDADMVDIRIKYPNGNTPVFAHGCITYKGDVYQTLDDINTYGKYQHRIKFVRIMLEEKNPSEHSRTCFRLLCEKLETQYTNITPVGGFCRYDWSDVVYEFQTPYPDIDEQICSVKGIGLFPRLWAWLHNDKILENGTDHDFLMIDFL